MNGRPYRMAAVEDRALFHIAAADALEGPQLEPLHVHGMRFDHDHPHQLAANETLHQTPPLPEPW